MLGSFFPLTETPESRTEVYMYSDGLLEVHNDVTFEANDEYRGGAVSQPLMIDSHLLGVLFCDWIAKGKFDFMGQLIKRRRLG